MQHRPEDTAPCVSSARQAAGRTSVATSFAHRANMTASLLYQRLQLAEKRADMRKTHKIIRKNTCLVLIRVRVGSGAGVEGRWRKAQRRSEGSDGQRRDCLDLGFDPEVKGKLEMVN